MKIIQQKAGAKKTPKKSTGDPKQGEEAHGILEGISSLHSWIKTQTMIRPHPKGGKGGKHGAIYDEVNILGLFFLDVLKMYVFKVHFLLFIGGNLEQIFGCTKYFMYFLIINNNRL